MRNVFKWVKEDHQWNRYAALRIILALSSLAGMILTSGAGSHWS
jgi:hypothetical protein